MITLVVALAAFLFGVFVGVLGVMIAITPTRFM